MRIGEVAKKLGLNPRTLRYYERIGLLPEPQRMNSGYRVYSTQDIERVAFIRKAQLLGLPAKSRRSSPFVTVGSHPVATCRSCCTESGARSKGVLTRSLS